MNEKFLHIITGLNEPYPSPDIPEDLAWEEMRKLLDEDNQKLSPPPPLSNPPNRDNNNWKYDLLLLFIIGIFYYLIWDKQGQVFYKSHSENVINKKENNQPKTSERNFREDDSTKDAAKDHHPLRTTDGEISGMKNKIKGRAEISGPAAVAHPSETNSTHPSETNSKNTKAIVDNNRKNTEKSIVITAENNSAGNKVNQKPDTSQSKNVDSLKNKMVKPNSIDKRKSMSPATPREEKETKRLALAAGLGFNQFFTLGSQQHSSYNSGGTVGALSDYIPVLFIRWYINKKLYLQIEGQINTPQYTKQLLAKHEIINDTSRPGQITEDNSVYINKLFYFNIPLSINYSPFQNFYAGAGLQFSQLTNGVGQFEGQEYSPLSTDTLSKSKFASIKEDPVYKEIKTIEWRILLDVNYQWQNLVLGVRYNQALSNFINVQVSSTQVTQARNNSVQLYLRYILWKNKKTKGLFSR